MYNMLGLAAECPFNDEHAGLTNAPDWGEAERYYLAALELDSLAILPAINLARMRIQRGGGDSLSSELTDAALDSVLAVFADASKRAPTLAEVEEAWGYSLMNRDKFEEAIRHLEIARKLDLTSVSVYRRLTRAYLTTGDTSKAIEMFSLGLARNGNDVEMLREYGHVLLNRGDYTGARRAFARALRQDTSDVKTRFHLAKSLRGESPEAAVRVYCSVQHRTKRGDDYRFETDSALATLANGQPCQRDPRTRPRIARDQRARAAS
jgi:tetratricopeptide (TPR) repeat protein